MKSVNYIIGSEIIYHAPAGVYRVSIALANSEGFWTSSGNVQVIVSGCTKPAIPSISVSATQDGFYINWILGDSGCNSYSYRSPLRIHYKSDDHRGMERVPYTIGSEQISTPEGVYTVSIVVVNSAGFQTSSRNVQVIVSAVTEGPEPTQRPPGTSDLPFLCTFETDLCGMYQRPDGEGSSSDDFDWTRQNGPTDTENTGPSGAKFGIFYIYAETSFPRNEGDDAAIETPSIRYTGDVCVRFWYHMFDSTNQNMGRLKVFRSMSGINIFDITGNKGESWIQANLDTTLSFGERIVFEAERGRDIQSDIALDNIEVQQGRCSQVPAPSPSPAPPTDSEQLGEILSQYSCDTERDGSSQSNCKLRQDTQDNMQWVMISGRTPSGRLGDRRINEAKYPVTGPSGAYQGSRYLYLEASGRPDGDMARLIVEGNNLVSSGDACLRFAYSMNGFHMGELMVYVMENGQKKEKWEMVGDQLQNWLLAAVDLRMNAVSQVGIEGYTLGEFSGDMAIDDIQLSSGRCYNIPSGYIWQCDFETSNDASTFCNMEQSTTDSQNYDWQLWNGPTPSEDTGPMFAYNGRYYLYLEASAPFRSGEFANVLLPRLERTGSVCVEFSYYMYGFHVGRLETFLRQNGFDGQQIFTISGEQEMRWRQARVGITNLGFNDQIGFRGVRGQDFSGDIAIDNVRVRQGICDSTENA